MFKFNHLPKTNITKVNHAENSAIALRPSLHLFPAAPSISYTNARFYKKKAASYPIPSLQIIDEMTESALRHNALKLNNTVFIGVQHMLETTVTLFDGLIKLGVKPQNMYFAGKCYSSAPEIEEEVRKRKINLMPTSSPKQLGGYRDHARENLKKMWQFCLDDIQQKKIKRIIILDEGGRCVETMPEILPFHYAVAGIEQTRAGLYSHVVNQRLFPLIDVATSAAKKHLEAKLIAPTVVKNVRKALANLALDKNTVCSVVGNGAIGCGIAEHLLEQGYQVIVYDQNEAAFKDLHNKNLYRVDDVKHAIINAQYIFGCTGKDITHDLDILSLTTGDKTFISCSSEDKEFQSLLRAIAKEGKHFNPLSDITHISNAGGKVSILKGGFPINFDRTPSSVPADKIELTRGLLLGACMQAVSAATKPIGDGITINRPTHQSLNPFIQKFVVDRWIGRQSDIPNLERLKSYFRDIDWISTNSGGQYQEDTILNACFKQEQPTEEMVSIVNKMKRA